MREEDTYESSLSVTSSAGCLSALLLVDSDLQHSAKLGEEVTEVLLCAAMRHITHKQLLTVATKMKNIKIIFIYSKRYVLLGFKVSSSKFEEMETLRIDFKSKELKSKSGVLLIKHLGVTH